MPLSASGAPLATATSLRAAKSLIALRDEVNAKFPTRKKDSYALPDGREIAAVRTGVSLYTQGRSPDRTSVGLVS
jgi:hypothetical protein